MKKHEEKIEKIKNFVNDKSINKRIKFFSDKNQMKKEYFFNSFDFLKDSEKNLNNFFSQNKKTLDVISILGILQIFFV